MKKTHWYNRKGQVFRIKISDYEKIEELGTKAGKYLTYDQSIDAWKLTDTKNIFNSDRTWKYSCRYDDEFDYNPGGEVSTYDCIAWSLGYLYTSDQFVNFMDMNM